MPAGRLAFAVAFAALGCGGEGPAAAAPSASPSSGSGAASPSGSTAFFYQDVAPSSNAVRAGSTTDGVTVTPFNRNVLEWQARGSAAQNVGDPTYSRLPNGRWVVTAWSAPDHPSGGASLLIAESDCPQMATTSARAVRAASGGGCGSIGGLAMAKTSQIFAAEGGLFLFTMSGARVYLLRVGDASGSTSALSSACVRSRPTSAGALAVGDAALVIGDDLAGGLLLSDAAVARRSDGTWALFVKGIAASDARSCAGAGGLCELCARSIYRSTSRDLLSWSALEKVVDQASVPDAATFPDGSVRLYWQDFSPACRARDLRLAERAPIQGAAEDAALGLGPARAASFTGEAFESNSSLHYPTNANPVALPDPAARAAFQACMAR